MRGELGAPRVVPDLPPDLLPGRGQRAHQGLVEESVEGQLVLLGKVGNVLLEQLLLFLLLDVLGQAPPGVLAQGVARVPPRHVCTFHLERRIKWQWLRPELKKAHKYAIEFLDWLNNQSIKYSNQPNWRQEWILITSYHVCHESLEVLDGFLAHVRLSLLVPLHEGGIEGLLDDLLPLPEAGLHPFLPLPGLFCLLVDLGNNNNDDNDDDDESNGNFKCPCTAI